MHAVDIVRNFVADLVRVPLLFKLALLYMAGAACWQWWKSRQSEKILAASATWPVHRARVVWAQVLERESEGKNGPSYWNALLTYSYTVPGYELEIGEYRKKFFDEEQADVWARGMRDRFVDVHVDPADPKRSLWHETEVFVPTLFNPSGMEAASIEPASWGIEQTAALIVFGFAATGAAATAWIQVSCIRRNPLITAEKDEGAFFAMHIGAILCGIASGFLAKKNSRADLKSLWRQSSKGSATEGWVIKMLSAYCTVVFLYGLVQTGGGDNKSNGLEILMFSAVWLMFYMTSASISWKAMGFKTKG